MMDDETISKTDKEWPLNERSTRSVWERWMKAKGSWRDGFENPSIMYSRLLPRESRRWRMDKYKKRNIAICLVITMVVIGTLGFTIAIYATANSHVFDNELDAPMEEVKTKEKDLNESTQDSKRRGTEYLNILFLVADDLRPTLGCYGDRDALTPNIDQISDNGFIFRKAYAQQALCAPSRTSLLTSRQPDSLRVYGNDKSYGYWRSNVGNFTSLPQYFKENGYHTASIGKIFHNGVVSNRTDDYPYSWSEIPYHPPTKKFKMKKVCPSNDGRLEMNIVCPVDVDAQPGQSLPDIQSTEAAIQFFDSYSKQLRNGTTNKPFFLGVGYYKPHIPLKYPKEYLEMFPLEYVHLAPNRKRPLKLPNVAWNPWTDIRLRDDITKLNVSFPYGPIPDDYQKLIKQSYYASVTYVDDLVGQLLQKLEDTGLSNNTVIVFFGDHGWSMGEHQEWSKYSNFDISLRVPLIISSPSTRKRPFEYASPFTYNVSKISFKSENSVDQHVELLDLFPSLVDIAGLPSIPNCSKNSTINLCTDGKSFAQFVNNNNNNTGLMTSESVAYSQYPRPSIEPSDKSDQPSLTDIIIMGYTLTDNRYRYTEWVTFDNARFKANWSDVLDRELYDHSSDPTEDDNIADQYPSQDLIDKLSLQLQKRFDN